MSRIASLLAGAAMLAATAGAAPVSGAPAAKPGEDLITGAWALYSSRFVASDGRVVDDGNGRVSHSEGQGYGMLIAIAADDRAGFERMLGWTRRELMVRGDALAAWRWDPAGEPRVADRNNATDGDLLIAWALLRASIRWGEPGWRRDAEAIAGEIARKAVAKSAAGPVLLPGVDGFATTSRPDGPVVNLSYWIFPAIEELEAVSPALKAARLGESGRRLVADARFGAAGLPAEWTALGGERPVPAEGFSPQFGYNAVRVPLYLAWSRRPDKAALGAMVDALAPAAGGPRVVDLATGATVERLADPGYRAVLDVADCALGRTGRASAAERFEPTRYYPTTLHLLSLIALAERYPQCLR